MPLLFYFWSRLHRDSGQLAEVYPGVQAHGDSPPCLSFDAPHESDDSTTQSDQTNVWVTDRKYTRMCFADTDISSWNPRTMTNSQSPSGSVRRRTTGKLTGRSKSGTLWCLLYRSKRCRVIEKITPEVWENEWLEVLIVLSVFREYLIILRHNNRMPFTNTLQDAWLVVLKRWSATRACLLVEGVYVWNSSATKPTLVSSRAREFEINLGFLRSRYRYCKSHHHSHYLRLHLPTNYPSSHIWCNVFILQIPLAMTNR